MHQRKNTADASLKTGQRLLGTEGHVGRFLVDSFCHHANSFAEREHNENGQREQDNQRFKTYGHVGFHQDRISIDSLATDDEAAERPVLHSAPLPTGSGTDCR